MVASPICAASEVRYVRIGMVFEALKTIALFLLMGPSAGTDEGATSLLSVKRSQSVPLFIKSFFGVGRKVWRRLKMLNSCI